MQWHQCNIPWTLWGSFGLGRPPWGISLLVQWVNSALHQQYCWSKFVLTHEDGSNLRKQIGSSGCWCWQPAPFWNLICPSPPSCSTHLALFHSSRPPSWPISVWTRPLTTSSSDQVTFSAVATFAVAFPLLWKAHYAIRICIPAT